MSERKKDVIEQMQCKMKNNKRKKTSKKQQSVTERKAIFAKNVAIF